MSVCPATSFGLSCRRHYQEHYPTRQNTVNHGLAVIGHSYLKGKYPQDSDSSIMTSLPDYSQEVRPLLNLILITTPLGSVLIPFLLILFFFSTPQSRRHPIFICNVLSCGCGICQAIITITMTTKAILYPLQPISRSLFTTASIFYLILSLFIDSIIMFRILAFYPLGTTPSRKLLMIFALPMLVKCGRLFAAVMYIHQLTDVHLANILVASELIGPKNPYILAAVALQMIDNG